MEEKEHALEKAARQIKFLMGEEEVREGGKEGRRERGREGGRERGRERGRVISRNWKTVCMNQTP